MAKRLKGKLFSVEGTVYYEDGKSPAPDLIVEVWDRDRICRGDYLGSSITAENGKYSVSSKAIALVEPFEGKPDVYVRIKNRYGEQLFSPEKPVKYEAGAHTELDVILPIPAPQPAQPRQEGAINPTPTRLFTIPSAEIERKMQRSDSLVEQLVLSFQLYLSKGNESALKREYGAADQYYSRAVRLIEVLADVKALDQLSDRQIKDITEFSAYLDEFVPTAGREPAFSRQDLVNRSFEIVSTLLNKAESSEADRKQRRAIVSESQHLGSELVSRVQALVKLGIQAQVVRKGNDDNAIERFVEIGRGTESEHIVINENFSRQLRRAIYEKRVDETLGERLVISEADNLNAANFAVFIPHAIGYALPVARGEALLKSGRFEEAIACFGQADSYPYLNEVHERPFLWAKTSQAYLQWGNSLYKEGQVVEARKKYEMVLNNSLPLRPNEKVSQMVNIVAKAFKDLLARRDALIDDFITSVSEPEPEEALCPKKNAIKDTTVFSDPAFLGKVCLDVDPGKVKYKLGGCPGWPVDPGVVDPVPDEFLATRNRYAFTPDQFAQGTPGFAEAMPWLAVQVEAYSKNLSIGNYEDFYGRDLRRVPVWRYDYLYRVSRRLAQRAVEVEKRLIRFLELADPMKAELEELEKDLAFFQAELGRVNAKIDGMMNTISDLGQAQSMLMTVTTELRNEKEDKCEVPWWKWVLVILAVIVVAAALIIGLAALTVVTEGWGLLALPGVVYALAKVTEWANRELTCDNIDDAIGDTTHALSVVNSALTDKRQELDALLRQRDYLESKMTEAQGYLTDFENNQASRYLNLELLTKMAGVMEEIYTYYTDAAVRIALDMQQAYNFEKDKRLHVIRSDYKNVRDDLRGRLGAEVLLRDIDSFAVDHIESASEKEVCIKREISFFSEYPQELLALRLAGHTLFSTRIDDFDRFAPGTYHQRIKRVDVVIEANGEPVRFSGFLSNFGSSKVRFLDPEDRFKIDNQRIFQEEHEAVRKLCYKRMLRANELESMNILHNESVEATITPETAVERLNFFENSGVEATWELSLSPRTDLNFCDITDVRLIVYYTALFDPKLKKVLEEVSFKDRVAATAFSLKALLKDEFETDLANGRLSFALKPHMFAHAHLPKAVRNIGLVFENPSEDETLDRTVRGRLKFNDSDFAAFTTDTLGVFASDDKVELSSSAEAHSFGRQLEGQDVVGNWHIEINPRDGGNMPNLSNVFLLVQYAYSS
jgi:tetratricopeptide (TPR) repeat protein